VEALPPVSTIEPADPDGDALAGAIDLEIECVDCRVWFFFGVGEQQFFANRGFEPPRRCRPCREAKRTRVQAYHDRMARLNGRREE
jgi:hypothetical protein